MNPSSSDLELVQAVVVEQLETGWAELVESYRAALRETLFTNRSEMRPSMIGQIADEAVDHLLDAFRQPARNGILYGEQLSNAGLSEQSVLRLGMVTRQFFIAHLENGQIAPVFSAVDTYLNQVVQGFVQNREKIILTEQEQIRSALHKTISRYTVEINEVQEIAQRATDANSFKNRLIAQISHELRTPVGALMGMAEILQQNIYGPLTSAQQDIVRRIIENAQNLNQIFTQLLDQSHIESGQLHLKEEEFSPYAVVQAVYSSQLPTAIRKHLSLHVDVHSGLPTILLGDKIRTMQILNNLVVNAIKYTQAGHVTIRAYPEDGHWAMEVADTGIGISHDAQGYIFEPFRQADDNGGRQRDGVGLGLSIVKQLVHAMDGTIQVSSSVGRGSTFTVMLPMRKV